jgi:hypothetical protein
VLKKEGRIKMEQVIPIEECAKQRLQVLVHSYTLFIKNLMQEGVDREIVKRASDKVWAILGQQAAEQLKPILGETINIEALQQAGAIAENVHGIEVNTNTTENELQSEFTKCPWNDALTAHDVPKDWRFCASGHVAFTESMYHALNPNTSYKLLQNMPAGDEICEGRSSV